MHWNKIDRVAELIVESFMHGDEMQAYAAAE
jgi:hypothetical protein